jgi:hypothetical protein
MMLKLGKRGSIGVSGILSVAVSIFLLHEYDTAQAGYVAVYPVLSMWILCTLAIVLGLVLLLPRRTRWAGTVTVVGGLALPCIFGVGVRISESAGWVLWANQPMQTSGPAVRAGEVVYYNVGVTDAQMESFQRASLYRSRADGQGFDFKPGITYFLHLSPSQAHGHDGFAIGISPSLPQNSRDQLRSTLAQSPLVFRVFHDTAPKDIPDP